MTISSLYDIISVRVVKLLKKGVCTIKIREFRKKAKLSQMELAEKLSVSQSAVAKWEKGENFPRTSILIQMIKIFNCTIDELVKGE